MIGVPETLAEELDLVTNSVGYIRVPRAVVVAEGPDTATFLHGQLSQDITALEVGQSAWSFLLQPQGKVDAWLRVSRVGGDQFVLDVDAGFGDAVLTRLRRFLLRTKCELSSVDWQFVAVRGPESGGLDVVATIVEDPGWPDVDGADLLGSQVLDLQGVDACSLDAYEVLRVRNGIPRMGAELDESTIPAATGLVERSVSFTKGCYVGQELVARVDSRGNNVPRTLERLSSTGTIDVGAALQQGGVQVGVVTSVVTDPRDNVSYALGYIGRAADHDAPLLALVEGSEIPVELI